MQQMESKNFSQLTCKDVGRSEW